MAGNFSSTFLQNQKRRLLEQKGLILRRQQFVDDLKTPSEDLSDEADLGQMILDQNYAIGLKERDLRLLKEIEFALKKIDEGEYGICEESGLLIEAKRLERLPWARLSIQFAEEEERRLRFYGR